MPSRKGHYRYAKAPLTATDDTRSLSLFIDEELSRIEAAFIFLLENPLPVSNKPPERLPQDEILFAFADGVNWDPGGGRGLYYYDPLLTTWKKVTVT